MDLSLVVKSVLSKQAGGILFELVRRLGTTRSSLLRPLISKSFSVDGRAIDFRRKWREKGEIYRIRDSCWGLSTLLTKHTNYIIGLVIREQN